MGYVWNLKLSTFIKRFYLSIHLVMYSLIWFTKHVYMFRWMVWHQAFSLGKCWWVNESNFLGFPTFPILFTFIFSSSHVLPAWGFQHIQMWDIFSRLIKTTILFLTAVSELVRQTLQILAKHTLSCFQSIHHVCLSKFIVWSQMRHILLMEPPDFYITTVIN